MSEHMKSNLILFVLTAGLSLLTYLWVDNQNFVEGKTHEYDGALRDILLSTNNVSNKLAANRTEWELREGRILATMETQAVSIERLLEITDRHNLQLLEIENRLNQLEKAIK